MRIIMNLIIWRTALFSIATLCAATGFFSSAHAAATTYPLTIANCGQPVTFDKAPEKTVSIGQGMTEILYSLGLADKIVGTAVWVGPVLPAYAEVNKTIKRLADNDPSFEAVVGQEPDLVAAEFEWHVGAEGSVGKREQFAGLGIRTYVSPADCVAKVNASGGDGVRKELFTMELIYQEIAELAQIYDIQDRGDALITTLKKREADAVASLAVSEGPADCLLVLQQGSAGRRLHRRQEQCARLYPEDARRQECRLHRRGVAAGRLGNDRRGQSCRHRHRHHGSPSLRRRRPEGEDRLPREGSGHQPARRRQERHFVAMDAQSMNPTIRTIDGLEILAAGIKSFGLAK
jgi:iron complex transport system substrate-binding protein